MEEPRDFLEELERESKESYKQTHLNLKPHPITILVQPELSEQNYQTQNAPNFNQFEGLAVPIQGNRSRSGSLVSMANSVGSGNFDTITECSDWGDSFGELLPFNGSTVVQVPSPWIRKIGSPSGSIHSRSGSVCAVNEDSPEDNKQVSYINFEDFFQNQNQPSTSSTSIYQNSLATSPIPYLNHTTLYPQATSPSLMPLSPNPYSDSVHQLNLQSPGLSGLADSSLLSPGLYSPNLQNPNYFSQQSSISNSDSNIYQHSAFLYPQPENTLQPYAGNDLFADNSEITADPIKLTIPDGRFWNVLKDNGQTLYQCPWPECKKTFTRPYNLKSHYRGHIGEKPYVCKESDCDAAFSRKHDLKRHLKSHSGEKKYFCKACGKTFSRNDALVRHLKPPEVGKESACALRLQLDALQAKLNADNKAASKVKPSNEASAKLPK